MLTGNAMASYTFGSNPPLMLKHAQAQQAGEGCGQEFENFTIVCFGETFETTVEVEENGTVQEPVTEGEIVAVEDQVQAFVDHAVGDLEQAVTILEDNGIEAVGAVNLTIIQPEPEVVVPVENETEVEAQVCPPLCGNETVEEEPVVTPIPEPEVCPPVAVEETPVVEEEPVVEVPAGNETVVEGNVTDPVVVIPVNETVTIPENVTEVVEVVENQTEVIVDATENVTSTEGGEGTEETEAVLSDEVQEGLLVLFQVQAEREDFDQLTSEQQGAIEGAIDELSGAIDEAVDVLT